jgi:hypothetical protein
MIFLAKIFECMDNMKWPAMSGRLKIVHSELKWLILWPELVYYSPGISGTTSKISQVVDWRGKLNGGPIYQDFCTRSFSRR